LTEEELKKFLADNLTVSVETNWRFFESDAREITIQIKLDGKVIAESSCGL
jgi:hypothetical protein